MHKTWTKQDFRLSCGWFRVRRNYPTHSTQRWSQSVSKTFRERESEKCIGRKNISRPLERKFHERAVESCTHCSIINKNHDTSIKERWGRRGVRRGKPIGRNINFEPTTDLKSWKVSTSFATTEIEDRRRAKREIEWRKKKHSEKSERKDYLEMLRSFANLVKI